jgi:hypothetical protein
MISNKKVPPDGKAKDHGYPHELWTTRRRPCQFLDTSAR